MSWPLANKNTKTCASGNFNKKHSDKKNSDKENMNSKKIVFYIGDTLSDDTILDFPKKQSITQDNKILAPRNIEPITNNKTNSTTANNNGMLTIENNIENIQCGNKMINMVMYILNLVF